MPGTGDRRQSCGAEPAAGSASTDRPPGSCTRTRPTCSPWTASRGSAPPKTGCSGPSSLLSFHPPAAAWPPEGTGSGSDTEGWQPHNVIQRRLVEGNPSRPQGEHPLVQAAIHGQETRRKTSKTERPALLVNCKCQDQVLQVAVDTGTHYNQISAGCLSRLGLGKRVLKAPSGDLAPGPPAQVEQLELQLGQATVACSAQVVDVESPELCLGLQTLLSLKCCIDLEHRVLRLKAPLPELPFLPLHQEPDQ
ncbi:nuclear receptor-interacting protein 2 isoform X3 [Lagenorhynchus albirostris]|uniref:nuclear receptor-interacting protein 2 isoform X3 n=1 Tax=Lagenorhynchus albirostris TaxID=27610 RepID=UPI0028E89837|nr:nuclear receptor-interacting protein 2 isoform X3 [Lagenorhynchus albirostris]